MQKVDETVEKLNRERQTQIASAIEKVPDPETDPLWERLNKLKGTPKLSTAEVKRERQSHHCSLGAGATK